MPFPLLGVLLAFVIASVIVDARSRRIPNLLSGTALLAGLVLNGLYFGFVGLAQSFGGAVLMLLVLSAPFAMGGLGGGDVKMMAAVGALIGPRLALSGLLLGMMAGGVIMVIHLAWRGRLREKLGNMRAMLVNAALTQSVAPLRVSANDPGAVALPYSVPLGLGIFLALAGAMGGWS